MKSTASRHRVVGGATLLVAVLLIAGCVVTAVYPYYTEKDLVFESSLLGDWVSGTGEDKPGEFTRVERVGAKGYRITAYGADETNSTIFHLFRLKGHLFLDSCPTNDSPDRIPVHQISRVTQLEPVLETANLDYKWLEELLKKNPKAIRHVLVRDQWEEKDESRIVLTAETAALQKFVLKHLNNTNAWQQPTRATRARR